MTNIKAIISKVESWQSFPFVKPLICPYCKVKLEPREDKGQVVLVCGCGYNQKYIPKKVLQADNFMSNKLKSLKNRFYG